MRLLYTFVFITLLYINTGLAQNVLPDSSRVYQTDNIVVTAGKYEADTKNIPARIEIINEKSIINAAGIHFSELIKTSPSVYIKSYGLSPFLQTLSMNGLGAEHTLVLIDGVKINSFQNSQVDLSIIPADDIRRIEIMNNGASAVYGSDALGGVINIITGRNIKTANDSPVKAEGSVSAGSFNTHRYSAAASILSSGLSTNIYYSSENSDGSYDYHYRNGKTIIKKQRDNAAYNIYNTGINSRYFIDSINYIRLISSFSFQDKQVPGIETGSGAGHTLQKDKNWNNILISENKLSHSLTLHTSLNFQNNYMNYRTSSTIDSYYKNLVYSASSDLNWKTGDVTIVSGYNFTHATLKSNETLSANRNQHAAFLSSEIMLLNSLRLFHSARYDFISDINKKVLTYKVGLNYHPFDKTDFALKGNAGKNFRAPSFNDLYWKESGNSNIKPENSFNAEAGVFYSFNYIARVTAEASFNYIEAKDKIVWTPQRNLLWSPQNIAESISRNASFTLKIEKDICRDFSLGINSGYILTRSKKTSKTYSSDPTYNKYIPYLPLESAKAGLTAEYKFITACILYTYSGRRYSDFENKKVLNNYNLLDASASASFILFDVNAKIKLSVQNLSDTDYETISGYPMPLRFYNLTLTINY
jgi:iron complex outermembrane receptor protein